jgi:hypothetical protein
MRQTDNTEPDRTLDPGETLLLQSSFESEPLYDVLSHRGFVHDTEQVEPNLLAVEIRHA